MLSQLRLYWKNLMVLTLMVFVTLYVVIPALYMYVHGLVYSRENLMGYPEQHPNTTWKSPIPRIIHSTWKDKNVPEKWQSTWHSCISLHEGYEQKLWTDAEMEEFIATEYPWFLPVYRSYPYPIQRADSFRYFILYHFGGIYVDLDVGCKKPVHEIMSNFTGYNVLLAEAWPTGVTNCLMASAPKHPLYQAAISRLPSTNWYLHGFPHMHVIFSAGPMFLTGTLSMLLNNTDVYIIPAQERETYFSFITGHSWHHWDTILINLVVTIPALFLAFLSCTVVMVCAAICWPCFKPAKCRNGRLPTYSKSYE